MPWVKVEKPYVFDTPTGEKTLAELFAKRSQLIIYHFMFGPDPKWKEGCPNGSFLVDHIDGANLHLPHHDVTLLVVWVRHHDKYDAAGTIRRRSVLKK